MAAQLELERAICRVDLAGVQNAVSQGGDILAFPESGMMGSAQDSTENPQRSATKLLPFPDEVVSTSTSLLGHAILRTPVDKDLVKVAMGGQRLQDVPRVGAFYDDDDKFRNVDLLQFLAGLEKDPRGENYRVHAAMKAGLECLDCTNAAVAQAVGRAADRALARAASSRDNTGSDWQFNFFALCVLAGGKLSTATVQSMVNELGQKVPLLTVAQSFSREPDYERFLARLIEEGCDPNGTDPVRGQTPLMMAAYRSDKKGVEVLLQHGADILKKDNRNFTAISWSKKADDKAEMVGLLSAALARKAIDIDNVAKTTSLRALD